MSVPVEGIVTHFNKLPIVRVDPDIVLCTPRMYYNCWGFVAATLGWTELRWLFNKDMEDLLKMFSAPIEKPEVGDIVVFRDRGLLTHTALLISDPSGHVMHGQEGLTEHIEVLHKPGNLALETNNLRVIYEEFPYGEVTEYRRAVGEG